MKRMLAWLLLVSLLVIPVQAAETQDCETVELPEISVTFEREDTALTSQPAEGEFVGSRYENQLSGGALTAYRAIMDSELGPYPSEDTVIDATVALGLGKTWENVTFLRESVDAEVTIDEETQQAMNEYVQQAVAQASIALEALIYDEPELSWLINIRYGISTKSSGSFRWDFANALVGHGSYTIEDVYFYIAPESYDDVMETGTYADYAAALEQVKAELEDDDGDFDIDHGGTNLYARARKIHEYVCENVSYAEGDLEQRKYQTIYSSLIDPSRISVCAGYAKLVKVLCDEYNVPCVLIRGTSYGEAHMWNYMKMADGVWYGVDATWDDNITTVSEGFFLQGKNVFDREHEPSLDWSEGYPLVYPKLAEKAYVPVDGDPMTGLLVANDRLSIALDGLEIAPTGDAAVSVVALHDSHGGWRTIRLNTFVEDAKLGCLVDFHGTHNPETDLYDVYGEVVLNDATVVYEVAAKDIDIYPNGSSGEDGSMLPEIAFTTKKGDVISIPAPAGSPSVPNSAVYDGTVFAESGMLYRLTAAPNGDLAGGCVQAQVGDAMLTSMGEAVPVVYRVISLDGGETVSYIISNPNYRVGIITSYRPDLNQITGAAVIGMNRDLSKVEVYRGIEKGDVVVATAENGKAVLHATESVVGRASNWAGNTVKINGRVYTGSTLILEENRFRDLEALYNSSFGRDLARGAVYYAYEDLLLAINEDAVYPVDLSNYAVVLHSAVDGNTATVKLGLTDGSTATYTVGQFYDADGEAGSAEAFANNAKVGSIVWFEANGGTADLTEEEPLQSGQTEMEDGGIVYNGRQMWAMDESLMFLLYQKSESERDVACKVYRMSQMKDCVSAPIEVEGESLNGAAVLPATRYSLDILIGAMTYGVGVPENVLAGQYSQLLGNVNLDGAVDVSDAVLLFQYSMLPDLYPIEYTGSVDFNKDGVVDVYDAVLLFQYSMLPDLYPIG